MDIRLRPHHGMCFQFYKGKGYSKEFTENMDDLLGRLSENNNMNITLTLSADSVCGNCPNNINGICNTEKKVAGYDRAVLEKCGFREGQTIPYGEFISTVKSCILDKNLREEICGDCSWNEICK